MDEIIQITTMWSVYNAKKGKFHTKNEKIPCKKQKIFPYVVRAILESGRLWHFLEVKFCFRTCHPNTLVSF
jgi:membrane protein CcdC involved in cytochrome C biogenesis